MTLTCWPWAKCLGTHMVPSSTMMGRGRRLPGSLYSLLITLTGARLLVPDGEAVFGQVADPTPSCHNLSSFGDPANGPIADLSQHRGNTLMFAEVSMLEKLQSSASLASGVCAVMTKSWENWEADELV